MSPVVAAAAALSVLLIGAGSTWLIMRPGTPPATMRGTAGAAASAPMPQPRPDLVISLTKEAIERAGIEISAATTATSAGRIRLPGVVEANAYRQVAVTPLVGGRVIRVSAALGDRVRRGQVLAQVYSPELAEARTTFVAARAMLDAHDQELQRTRKLVEIGAASRQELERIHATHAAQTAAVESARARLQLLGATSEDPAATQADSAIVTISAPIDGVVTERLANSGLNVDPTVKLFSIVDLSSVWIVADVYEKDLGRVREGAAATVTTAAYPDRALRGRVSYVDPQLDAGTRTAKVRIEVANPDGELRLGMYADVAIDTGHDTSVVVVPKGAIQNVGGRQVVYVTVTSDPTTFVERDVQLGNVLGDVAEVVSGLSAGESVVSKGSFFLRAEAERLTLRSTASSGPDPRQ